MKNTLILLKLWIRKKVTRQRIMLYIVKQNLLFVLIMFFFLLNRSYIYNRINGYKQAEFNFYVQGVDEQLINKFESLDYVKGITQTMFHSNLATINFKGQEIELNVFAIESFDRIDNLTILKEYRRKKIKDESNSIGLTYNMSKLIDKKLGDELPVKIKGELKTYIVSVIYEPVNLPYTSSHFIVVPFANSDMPVYSDADAFIKAEKDQFRQFIYSDEFVPSFLQHVFQDTSIPDSQKEQMIEDSKLDLVKEKDDMLISAVNKVNFQVKVAIFTAIISLLLVIAIILRDEDKEFYFMKKDISTLQVLSLRNSDILKYYMFKTTFLNSINIVIAFYINKYLIFSTLLNEFVSKQLLIEILIAVLPSLFIASLIVYFCVSRNLIKNSTVYLNEV